MNLAGALAQVAVAVELPQPAWGTGPTEAVVEPALPERLAQARDATTGLTAADAIADFRAAVRAERAADLIALLLPATIDAWAYRGAPGLPSVVVGDEVSLLADADRVDEHDEAGRAVVASEHLEARRIGELVVVSPQDDDLERLTVGVLVPIASAHEILLATVSAPLATEPGWNNVATQLVALAEQAREEPLPERDCRPALVPARSGGLTSGCAHGACAGKCRLIATRVVEGVQRYRCECRTDPVIGALHDASGKAP